MRGNRQNKEFHLRKKCTSTKKMKIRKKKGRKDQPREIEINTKKIEGNYFKKFKKKEIANKREN